MNTVLITGANRGLGLEFTKQFLEKGFNVIATTRSASLALEDIRRSNPDKLRVAQLDVTSASDIAELAASLKGEPIDILLNNAGVFYDRGIGIGNIDYDQWRETLEINTMAPLRMTEAFLDNILQGRKKLLVFFSSDMASIANNDVGGAYLYRSSKAGLNAVVKSLAVDLKQKGITVLALHPGWVKTDMGGPDAALTPEESVRRSLETIESLRPEESGMFLGFDRYNLPW